LKLYIAVLLLHAVTFWEMSDLEMVALGVSVGV
jgi:hypothetical protein